MDKLWQRFWKLKFMKNQALELHSPLPKSFKVCKEKEAKRKTEDSSCSLLWHFWSTSRSPFSTCYIPFQSSGSQESNASNHVRFGAEMRKIWPSQDNYIQLKDKFASCEFGTPMCEIKAQLAKVTLQLANLDLNMRKWIASCEITLLLRNDFAAFLHSALDFP